MPIDWDQYQRDLATAAADAGARTDAKLAGDIARLTRLTEEEIGQLFPNPGDVQKLAALMAIVKGSGERNDQINRIVANAEGFAGIVLTLLQKLA